MPMYINTNVASLAAQKNLGHSQSALAKSFNKLSSGSRINTAADDAAGLAISESMKSQIRSYNVSERNANDAISMSQTAEGSLGTVTDILGRMRELATQGANGALASADRAYLGTEFKQLQAEISRVVTSTKFNGQSVINGTSTLNFQVGINNTAADRITVTFGAKNGLTSVVASGTTKVTGSAGNAQKALDQIDAALSAVSTSRARFGAAMNRFESVTANIQTVRLNISAANSRIRDVDVAEETATLSRTQVLTQAGTSILAQANQSPQAALGLLR
jgi:flagellin